VSSAVFAYKRHWPTVTCRNGGLWRQQFSLTNGTGRQSRAGKVGCDVSSFRLQPALADSHVQERRVVTSAVFAYKQHWPTVTCRKGGLSTVYFICGLCSARYTDMYSDRSKACDFAPDAWELKWRSDKNVTLLLPTSKADEAWYH
jgi:hypothetical protein